MGGRQAQRAGRVSWKTAPRQGPLLCHFHPLLGQPATILPSCACPTPSACLPACLPAAARCSTPSRRTQRGTPRRGSSSTSVTAWRGSRTVSEGSCSLVPRCPDKPRNPLIQLPPRLFLSPPAPSHLQRHPCTAPVCCARLVRLAGRGRRGGARPPGAAARARPHARLCPHRPTRAASGCAVGVRPTGRWRGWRCMRAGGVTSAEWVVRGMVVWVERQAGALCGGGGGESRALSRRLQVAAPRRDCR